MKASEDQIRKGLELIKLVGDSIRQLCKVRDGSYPSGELYAQLTGHMSLEEYQRIIDILKDARLITVKHNLLTWVGPQEPLEPSNEVLG